MEKMSFKVFISEYSDSDEIVVPYNIILTDLEGISPTVKSIYISESEITDIKPLEGNQQLETLSIRNSKISDITPLVSCTSLKHLNLNSNSVTDISSLKNLNLESLEAENNRIESIIPIWDMIDINGGSLTKFSINPDFYNIECIDFIIDNHPSEDIVEKFRTRRTFMHMGISDVVRIEMYITFDVCDIKEKRIKVG